MVGYSEPGSDHEQHPHPKEERIIGGTPYEVVKILATERMGIGIFSPKDIPSIEEALVTKGFVPTGEAPRTSEVSTKEYENPGTLHRHGEDGIIVHQTSEGEGKANFYWPEGDLQRYSPDFDFDPEIDEVVASATDVRINPGVVVMFPTNTWHQFGTDPHNRRVSKFRTYTSNHE